jgi:DNA ligase-1
MKYTEIVELCELLAGTTKKFEKVRLLADFIPKLKGHTEWIYLLRGRVFAEYDMRESGISGQLTIKAIAKASGVSIGDVVESFKKKGDLGDVAAELLGKKKQHALFSTSLSVQHVLDSLRKLCAIEGSGTVDRKMGIIVELLLSASANEARYLTRTLLGDLRVGVADALLLDAIVAAFFPSDESMRDKVKYAYDFITDFARVLDMAFRGKHSFDNVPLEPGRPFNVMLAVKAENFEEAFDVCGSPAALEHKYDGFRVIISSDGSKVKLFTRRLEEVTSQFPDIVAFAKEHINAKSFIVDSEVVGYNPQNHIYLPFEAISQRIKRKHDIAKLVNELPVEVNVFDILSLNGATLVDLPFLERRKRLQSIIEETPWKIRLAKQIVTSNLAEAERFYKGALKMGEEGVMVKKIDAPYRPGRAVGYMVKVKPLVADLDLVVVGGEYGTGKRAGGLTSFIVACRSGDRFLEVGRVSSGLKEKASEGVSYGELNAILQPLIIQEEGSSVSVKPAVVVSVTYQNIQVSPTYDSGFALRFPRITHYRPERGVRDIATLDDIQREVSRASQVKLKK